MGSLKRTVGNVFCTALCCPTLFSIDNNAESQMDKQNTSLCGLCKAEHGHGKIIFTSCCEDHELPGKQIEHDYFSLSFIWLSVL